MEGFRLCARQLCGGNAAATLTYHYGSRTAWIDNLDEEREPHAYDLCERHAAKVNVPVGWALEDRRTPIIPLRPSIAV